MTKHLITRALAVSLALSTLAGCSQSALVTATTSDAAALQAAANGQNGKNAGGRGQKGDRGQMGQKVDFYADLDLTDDQKAQLQAIAEKYAPAEPADGTRPEAPGAKLQALLVADTLDVDVVKAALAEKPAAPPADNRLERLVAERAVLTEAQIAQIVAKLQAAPDANRPSPDANRPSPDANRQKPDAPADAALASRPAMADKVATDLGLDDTQKAAFTAFQAALEANRPAAPSAQPERTDRRAAELAFWQTGDTTALAADKPAMAEAPAFPVDAFLAFATSLTVEQRQKVFAKGAIGLGFGPGGHEGPGGPGGREGHGGPGGFGGGDRPAPPAAAQ